MNARKKAAVARPPGARRWTPPTRQQVEAVAAVEAPPPVPGDSTEGGRDGGAAGAPAGLPADIAADSTHAHVYLRAAQAAAVLRTLLAGDGDRGYDGPLAAFSAERVAAAFLCGLGEEVGGRVCRELTHGEQAAAARAVARSPQVTHAQGMHALQHVRQRMETGDYLEPGGPDYARRVMSGAVNEGRARWLVEQAVAEKVDGFEVLAEMNPAQGAAFIANELPQTAALILSQLSADRAGALLEQLPEGLQADVAYRLSAMDEVDAGTVERLRQSLGHGFRDARIERTRPGGPRKVAAVLKHMGQGVENRVLGQMDQNAPAMAEAVRNWMYTFEDLVQLSDKDLQRWLREVDQHELVVALKGATEALKQRLFSNMSERVQEFLKEEIGFITSLPAEEVEAAQLRLVRLARQLEQAAEITIPRGERAFAP